MGGYKHAGWTLKEWTARLRDVTSETGVFTTTELNGLDEPVRRHLSQAIAPGTQLAQCAQISMRGRIKLGRWLPFRARQILRPDTGFIWSAQSQDDLRARYLIDDVPIDARYSLGPGGELQSTVFDRWGDPDETGQWGWHRFGGIFTEQRTFGGLTIPSAGRLGWHFGTDRWDAGEFFRFQITNVKPLHPEE